MTNVIIDLGNYDIKYLSKGIKGKFSSKISTEFNPNPEAFERVEYNNQITYIGIGALEREYNKVDKNFMPSLLYAINKATTDNNINLCLLLPVNQLPKKDVLKNMLEGKKFNFKVNGKDRAITINKLAVLPEGYCSYYSLTNVQDKDILIIDIGSRTVNFASFIEGKIEKNFTHKLGIYDLYKRVKEIENSKGNDYIEEDIERLIKRENILVDDSMYLTFLKDILNAAKGNINLKNYDVKFVGGGSIVLKKYIEKNTPAEVIDNSNYCNVIGAENICKAVWR